MRQRCLNIGTVEVSQYLPFALTVRDEVVTIGRAVEDANLSARS